MNQSIDRLSPVLRELVRPHVRRAWVPRLGMAVGEVKNKSGEVAADGSRLGGWCGLRRGEEWPECGACDSPLAPMLQLNSSDVPGEARGVFGPSGGVLQLMYCTNDDCDTDLYAPFSVGHLVRIVKEGTALVRPDLAEAGVELLRGRVIDGWESADDLPNLEELLDLGVELTEAQQAEVYEDEQMEFPVSGEKLLGWPYWVQGVEYPDCRRCGRRMEMLFQIDSDRGLGFGFGDSGVGHITVCPEHRDELAFGWACC